MEILSKKFYFLLFMAALSSCNYVQEFSQPQVTALSPPNQNKIKTVAILPLKNFTDNDEIPAILRQSIFGNLSLREYELIKIKDIDYRIASILYQDSTKWHIIFQENQDVIKDTKDILVGQVLLIPLHYENQKISQTLY